MDVIILSSLELNFTILFAHLFKIIFRSSWPKWWIFIKGRFNILLTRKKTKQWTKRNETNIKHVFFMTASSDVRVRLLCYFQIVWIHFKMFKTKQKIKKTIGKHLCFHLRCRRPLKTKLRLHINSWKTSVESIRSL